MHKVLAILKECLIPLKKATVLVFGVIGAVADVIDVWIIEVEAVKPFLPYVRQISLLVIVIYIWLSIAIAKYNAAEQMKAEHRTEMEQLREEHDQEMVEMAEKLLAKATEAKVISYAPNGKEGELTAGPLCNSLVKQLVSIKIDQRWTAPTVQVLVGIGVIVARDEDFTIIKIIRKYPHSNEWKYITDANEEQHREQLAHTTVSTAIPYSVLRRVSK